MRIPAASRPSCAGVALGGAGDPLGELGHVVALVAVLRHRLVARAGAHRRAEPLDLRAGVVEVVLADDLVAGQREQPGERVAVGGVAGAGRGQRAGRVGGDVLDVDLLRALRDGRAPVLARRSDLARPRATYQASDRKTLRKPGPATSTRSTASPSRSRTFSPSRSAISRGGAPQRGREQHRGVGRVVAEAGLLGALEARPSCCGAGPPLRRSAAAASTAARRSSSGVTSMMVRLAGQDLVGAEELLEQHDAGQQVRQRHRPERQPVVGPLAARCRRRRRSRSTRRGPPGGAPRASPRSASDV